MPIEAVAKTPERGELRIYGPIVSSKWMDEDVTPTEIAKELDKLKNVKDIDLYINSPGGNVFAGLAIYQSLKRHAAKITAYVDGFAGSISAVIFQAADKRIVAKNSMVMVHNAMGGAWGYASEIRKVADIMDKITNQIRGVLADRAGTSKEDVAALMDAETYMTAEESVAFGFADEIEANKSADIKMQDGIVFVNGVELTAEMSKKFPLDKLAPQPPSPPAAKKPEPIDEMDLECMFANHKLLEYERYSLKGVI